MLRTVECARVTAADDGKQLKICGWVHYKRDLGGILFIHLRDRSGRIQIFVDPEKKDVFEIASKLHYEDVVRVEGVVRRRPAGQEIKGLSTGDVEVVANAIEVLGPAKPAPFVVEEDPKASEELRLKYRYLDLRRPSLQNILILRSKVACAVRNYLEQEGFLEIETPCLVRSTPEGARDYLVPSRVFKGHFYALPQSPQLFKQLLMISGLDRYFQLARCFRDEDLRADRQPEFTQIDLEASFVEREDIIRWTEGIIKTAFAAAGFEVKPPFPWMTYQEAFAKYGTDRPDLRIPYELVDLTDCFKKSEFKPFVAARQEKGVICGLNPKGTELSRKRLDELSALAKEMGGGLVYAKIKEDGWQSSAAQHLSDDEKKAAQNIMNAATGDTLLIAAGHKKRAREIMGAIRVEVGKEKKTAENRFLWIVDFPLLEWSEEEKRHVALHHPFTSPMAEDLNLLETDPQNVRSLAYDIVLNGTELGGGSIRIHNPELQKRVFKCLDISEADAEKKFGFLLEALSMGCPPHGGIALGFDRLIMMLAGAASIRDVIAFPKTASASDLMCGAPAEAAPEQLKDLGLKQETK